AARTDLTVLRLDLNGDGRLDLARAHFGEWSTTPLDFLRADGSRAAYPASGAVEQRVEQLRFKGMRLPAFLVQSKPNGEPNGVTIMAAQENQYDKTWTMEAVYGWAPKSYGAPADRVRWTEDGNITIEWDMKDPSRHTRVTSYTWLSTPERSNVKLETLTYRPEGKELVYPATPKGVLEAAFVARWLDLQSELPRYFASPQAAAAFVADKRVSRPDYGPGTVQIGKVTPPEQLIACGATVIEAEPKGPGPHSFAAKWGGYEWCQGVWGTVTFGTDPQGRPVIQELKLEGTASNSL
ncbi:MAG TPA: hypothetical protein VNT75_33010, partial [Symbiobacteriaceae bacterium]|nr:hypothetical protein [Symbiobacteriaceae bacterium]